MKEYKISEIMEDYTDNEFFVEGEQTVDTEKAVSELLGQVKSRKKRIKPLFKVLIAAAAAVVLAGAATAATIAVSSFTTATNLKVTGTYNNVHTDSSEEIVPIRVEEGNRLIFTADGDYTDITDLVDENTPYIYRYINDMGYECYVIVGGTAGNYGYVDLYTVGMGRWDADLTNARTPEEQHIVIPDGTHFDSEEECDAAYEEVFRSERQPWYSNALDELGVDVMFSRWTVLDPIEFNESIGYVFPVE